MVTVAAAIFASAIKLPTHINHSEYFMDRTTERNGEEFFDFAPEAANRSSLFSTDGRNADDAVCRVSLSLKREMYRDDEKDRDGV